VLVLCRMVDSGDASSAAEAKHMIDVIVVQDSNSNKDGMFVILCKLYITSAVAQFLLNWPYDAVRPNQVVQFSSTHFKVIQGHLLYK